MVQLGVKELTYITLQLREKTSYTNSFRGRELKPFQNPTLSEYEYLVITAHMHRQCTARRNILSFIIRQLGKLGSGEFGTVCKGRWKYSDQVLDVAIKALSNASDESSKVKFLQEAAIMSQFRHPNVIKLYGVICDADQVYVP